MNLKRKKIITILAVSLYSKVIFSQNVGIGVNNPLRAKLEVNGAVGVTTAIFGGNAVGISLQSNDATIGFNQYNNNTPKFLGNGYAAAQRFDHVSGAMLFQMYNQGIANNDLGFPIPAITLSRLGRVNIGSSVPANAMLNVSRGQIGVPAATAAFEGTKHHSFFNYGDEEHTYIRAGKDGSSVFINDGGIGRVLIGGSVGIGTATPSCRLEVRQNGSQAGFAIVNSFTFNYWRWRVDDAGPLSLEAGIYTVGSFNHVNGQYHAVSDSRLKTNVYKIASVLDKVMQLKPVKYEMINNNPDHKEDIGFIAQDVQKVFPELVIIKADSTGQRPISDLHTLNYSGFGTIAIKAIQEQQQIIKRQEITMKQMKMELDELKKAVSEIMLQKR